MLVGATTCIDRRTGELQGVMSISTGPWGLYVVLFVAVMALVSVASMLVEAKRLPDGADEPAREDIA